MARRPDAHPVTRGDDRKPRGFCRETREKRRETAAVCVKASDISISDLAFWALSEDFRRKIRKHSYSIRDFRREYQAVCGRSRENEDEWREIRGRNPGRSNSASGFRGGFSRRCACVPEVRVKSSGR